MIRGSLWQKRGGAGSLSGNPCVRMLIGPKTHGSPRWAGIESTRRGADVSFCEHCQGQRFDRARVLRLLRQMREDMRSARAGGKVDAAMAAALKSIKTLDIPHLEPEEPEDQIVH